MSYYDKGDLWDDANDFWSKSLSEGENDWPGAVRLAGALLVANSQAESAENLGVCLENIGGYLASIAESLQVLAAAAKPEETAKTAETE